jgi:hypothetical protein
MYAAPGPFLFPSLLPGYQEVSSVAPPVLLQAWLSLHLKPGTMEKADFELRLLTLNQNKSFLL